MADLARAHHDFRRACDAGSAPSCKRLAADFAEGNGVAKDASAAQQLYRRVCDGGDADACAHYGDLLLLAGDREQGMAYLRKGCTYNSGVNADFGCTRLMQLGDPGTPPPSAPAFPERFEPRCITSE